MCVENDEILTGLPGSLKVSLLLCKIALMLKRIILQLFPNFLMFPAAGLCVTSELCVYQELPSAVRE